ncbi:dTDP-4-dehydrorhamnose reductase [Microbulbifer donghaiensis]|uniref:dTDP-4-dehydrorhamnose reductase n=1 Tax=Microbulbifer donghaiensis TaxID=494016 RepID=A0A1M5CIN7_9GAMM|nr:dTDP-4-dehydrorhamnose reductase [Microbulbifer donghaiensis]SHF54598.1 dTDP-4-dehydrorhamnose reductase [Microbulbifer donghaiensis]
MKVLLFGATGQLGRECRKVLGQAGWALLTPGRDLVDFAQPETVAAAVENLRPQLVVNACAFTAVDQAEAEPQLAELVNGVSVGRLAAACAELQIPTIHVSTDYVFDGSATTPYHEGSVVAPLNKYGHSKLQGEQLLRMQNRKHVLLRTSWVFSARGNNFVKTMIRLGAQRSELSVVGDQVGCPTYAGDLAFVIGQFIERYQREGNLRWGTYHCSNAEPCSWYEFAQAVMEQGVACGLLRQEPLLQKITSEEYPFVATRPAYSVLDCSKLEARLETKMPSWRQGLERVCAELAGAMPEELPRTTAGAGQAATAR